MVKRSKDNLLKLFRYFFGAILAIYGIFAFFEPTKYPIAYVPSNLVPLAGLIIVFIGLVVIFYENEK